MNITFVDKFARFHDGEYIAQAFESLGHTVSRIPDHMSTHDLEMALLKSKPDIILFCKWSAPKELDKTLEKLKKQGMRTVCWLFDLYFGYPREHQVRKMPFFRADYVFTTDGGHDKEFKDAGVNHQTVRQGIAKEECFLLKPNIECDVTFIGSISPLNMERNELMYKLTNTYDFRWYGRTNTNQVRGKELNEKFAETKIVVGNSVYSPYYWSNRVVETLGRGGFLIHQEVEGIKEEYPHLVTYERGNDEELFDKIDYYLSHESERQEIVQKNFEWVRDNYTMDKKCAELISKL